MALGRTTGDGLHPTSDVGAISGCSRRTGRMDARHSNAYLDDHAFLLAALIELMQTAFRSGGLVLGHRNCRPSLSETRLEQLSNLPGEKDLMP